MAVETSIFRLWPRCRAARLGLLTNLAIAGLWLWLYRAVFDELGAIFSRQEFRANQLALLGIAILLAARLKQDGWQAAREVRLERYPHVYLPAAALAAGASGLYLLGERSGGWQEFSASLFGLGSYGLLGLWLAPRQWRGGLPAGLLLVGALPLGEFIQTYLGYPMRILTANILRDLLALAGAPPLGAHTILVFENGITKIDLPCSGVKSLWTGLMFLIAAAWIERRPTGEGKGRRWRGLLAALALVVLVFSSNLARVGVLVLLGQVAGWRRAAEMVHLPLGMLGFAGACAAALALLRAGEGEKREGVVPAAASQSLDEAQRLAAPAWLGPALAAAILAAGLLSLAAPGAPQRAPLPAWDFPAALLTRPLPFSAGELQALREGDPEAVERRRFEYQTGTGERLSGLMLTITSRTWRAHHRPERCFEALGLSQQSAQTYLVRADFPLRYLALQDSQAQQPFSAVYWFQSSQLTTEDYNTRVWADLRPERQRWVLVTVLFDQPQPPGGPALLDFYAALHTAVQRSLQADSQGG